MAYVEPCPHEQEQRPARHATRKRRIAALFALGFAIEAAVFRLASAYFSDGLVGFVFTLTTLLTGTSLVRLVRQGAIPATMPR